MRITCDIIRDLLAIYHDGVCSQDTRQLVEEHLSTCSSCAEELINMDKDLTSPNVEQNLDAAKSAIALSKCWKKDMLAWLLRGIVATAGAIGIILILLYIFVGFQVS